MQDKKTPPGGERSRGGANKGTEILRVETDVPRQLVNLVSNYHAKVESALGVILTHCYLSVFEVAWLGSICRQCAKHDTSCVGDG